LGKPGKFIFQFRLQQIQVRRGSRIEQRVQEGAFPGASVAEQEKVLVFVELDQTIHHGHASDHTP
jgi:hypothetical protein